MKGYVYILEMSNWKWYTGSTRDLEERIARHQRGWVKATKNCLPLKLLYYREYESIGSAVVQEQYLKRMKSRNIIELFMQWV